MGVDGSSSETLRPAYLGIPILTDGRTMSPCTLLVARFRGAAPHQACTLAAILYLAISDYYSGRQAGPCQVRAVAC